MKSRFVLWTTASLLLAGLMFALAPSGAGGATLGRPPYLQVTTESSIVVRWRTDVATATTLHYGAAPDRLTQVAGDDALTTEHAVKIEGLEPATRYFYSVGENETILAGGDEGHQFTTAPPRGSRNPIRLWVIGDSGECAVSAQGCADAGAVRDAYLQQAGNRPADLWLMLGDNAYYRGTDLEYTKAVFEVYPQVMRSTPLWTTLGNHETYNSNAWLQSGPYFDAFTMPIAGEAGGVPSGTEAYYAFDWGNIHFISIDSATGDANYSATGAMYQWLEADLAQNTADWTIVFWHHPPYTKGSHDSDNPADPGLFPMREVFVPLIESYGVDLQLTGHSHSYERSHLIDGHYGTSDQCGAGQCFVNGGDGDPEGDGAYPKDTLGPAPHEGTVYSVVGSSSKNSPMIGHHPVMAFDLSYEGSLLVDVAGNRMDAQFIDKDGLIRDRFRILKGERCPSCTAAHETLSEVGFPPGIPCDCAAAGSIATQGAVWAPADSTVTLTAPLIRLLPGFGAADGSQVYAAP